MNTHYIFPVCVAGAVHAALLLGFTKSPRTTIAKAADTFTTCFLPPPPPLEELPIVQPDEPNVGAKGTPEVPFTRSLEPIPVIDLTERFYIETPLMPAVRAIDFYRLPVGPIGTPDGDNTKNWGELITGPMLDNPPRTRFQTQPIYPIEAKKAGMSGRVDVEFLVDETGRIVEPRVLSSTDRIFEEATLRAVAKWQFEPGRRAGRIVRFKMSVPVIFTLND